MTLGVLLRSAQRFAGTAGALADTLTGSVADAGSAAANRAADTAATVFRLPVVVAGAVVAAGPTAIDRAPARGLVTDVVAGSARLTARAAVEAAHTPARATTAAAGAARLGRSAVAGAPHRVAWTARALADPHPRRTHRRVWQGRDHAQIEVRGLAGTEAPHRRVGGGVRRALTGLSGVRWAEVNAVTGQVLVAFDERRVDVGTLLDTVRAVEDAQHTREEDFSWEAPVHPSDSTPLAEALVELAADSVGFVAAVVGRVAPVPPLPRAVRVGLAVLDLQPQLRRRLVMRIGPVSTEVLLSLTHAAVQGLSQKPLAPAIDAVHRTQLLAEVLSRRTVWQRREPELCWSPEVLPDAAPPSTDRPQPLPNGPIEGWSHLLGPGSLAAAAAVLALTRQPRRGADTFLAAVPRAATLGRESFAATVARRLAGGGVVPLDASAYRRLDRVSAVLIDSAALTTPRAQILSAAGERADVREVWHTASGMLHGHNLPDLSDGVTLTDGRLRLQRDPRVKDPRPGVLPLVLRQGNRRLGTVLVGGELAPLAEAVVDAARESGARVLLTDDDSVSDLVPRVDEVLPADRPLAEHVRRLQDDGHGVLCVSATADEALAAADVGVGVLGHGHCPWTADLLCGPGLRDVWRVLAVAGAARPLSERVLRLAQAGTALGTLLALVGGRRRGASTHALGPVYAATVLGLAHGARTGRTVTGRQAPTPVLHVPWHALDPGEVLERLADEPRADATDRPVVVLARQVRSAAGRASRLPLARQALAPVRGTVALTGAVREELHDPLTPVLALGAASSAVVGSVVDAALVAAVLTGNSFVSGAQRWRADQALRGLLAEQTLRARRVSCGVDVGVELADDRDPTALGDRLSLLARKTVPAPSLVPGDVIALRASDVVPADARLLWAGDLEVDEATLTGESLPVPKDVEATPGARITERSCMVFGGTTVLAGSAYAVVVATGESTEGGRAARAAGRAGAAAGVQARLAEITRIALPATGIGGAGVAGLGLLRGVPLRAAVAAGVSVAVAAVPEGLPLVATVAQAGAARRLSRRGVLARSSRTLEALGRVDTVCFDKTGTLTKGRLSVSVVAPAGRDADADCGPDEEGARGTLEAAARACPAVDDVSEVPHATDRAVLEAARADERWEVRSECSFEASRGYSASLGLLDDTPVLAVKGAPEVVLPLCSSVEDPAAPLTSARRRTAEETVRRLADRGLRVLAVAERRSGVPEESDDLQPLVEELTLVGYVGIADSPREGAAEAVRAMVDAGIRPVMVTGDHPDTAGAVARAVGLPAEHVLTGAELDTMTEEERVRRAAETTVFARVSPEQKVRIVEALRAAGRVVAMTGDGTNDAAAIRLADVGIGVGAAGSSAARSAADLVLSEPDLMRINDAVVEGRAMWDRMREAVSILVGGNAGEMAFMLLGTAAAARAPINIRQMLLVNLLTDMFPALAVAIAPLHGRETAPGPVGSSLGAPLARTAAVRGTTTAMGATLAWTVGRFTGRGRRADSMGLAALVGTQLGQTLLIGWRSPLVVATVAASAVVLFAAVETPGVSQFFGCTPIGPVAWTVVGGATAAGTLAAALAPRLPRPDLLGA